MPDPQAFAPVIARANMQDFLLRNAERWLACEGGTPGIAFIVITKEMAGTVIGFTDQAGCFTPLIPAAPGYAYRVVVQAVEEVSLADIEARPSPVTE